MKLKQLFEDTPHRLENFLPNIISSDDPAFGDAYDAFDDVREMGGQKFYPDWNSLTYPEKAKRFPDISKRLGRLASVPIAKLISTEPELDYAHLQKIVAQGNQKGPATVFIHKGKPYIMNGNHRVAADAVDGGDRTTALVIRDNVQI